MITKYIRMVKPFDVVIIFPLILFCLFYRRLSLQSNRRIMIITMFTRLSRLMAKRLDSISWGDESQSTSPIIN